MLLSLDHSGQGGLGQAARVTGAEGNQDPQFVGAFPLRVPVVQPGNDRRMKGGEGRPVMISLVRRGQVFV